MLQESMVDRIGMKPCQFCLQIKKGKDRNALLKRSLHFFYGSHHCVSPSDQIIHQITLFDDFVKLHHAAGVNG